MSEWRPIESAPKDGTRMWVAFHGCGHNRVQIVSWSNQLVGRHGNWDYINSHYGRPQWWMPLEIPEPPDQMEGPRCECDGCLEKYERPPSLARGWRPVCQCGHVEEGWVAMPNDNGISVQCRNCGVVGKWTWRLIYPGRESTERADNL